MNSADLGSTSSFYNQSSKVFQMVQKTAPSHAAAPSTDSCGRCVNITIKQGKFHHQRSGFRCLKLRSTIWLFNIAMENDPFIDGLSIKHGGSSHGKLLVITRW